MSRGGTSGGASIQHMIRNDRKFKETCDAIREKIANDFDRAEEHAHSFDNVRPIYDFNSTWDYEAYKAESHDMGELKTMLEMINEWNKELEKLRNKPIGVLEIDSKRLKNELNPLREARLTEIKSYVQNLAKSRCISLIDTYKEHLSKLALRPTLLKDFAGQVAIIKTMKENERTLFKAASSVDQMYALLVSCDVQVPPEDSVLHEDLHDKQAQYKQEIEAAQQLKDDKLAEMVTATETNITKLEDQITGVVAHLEDEVYTNSTSFGEADKLLEELQGHQAKLQSFENLGKTYSGYQTLFGEAHEFATLDTGLKENVQASSIRGHRSTTGIRRKKYLDDPTIH